MSVRRSSYFAFASRYASFLINFVATLFVARLLTPAEIGVFAVSAALVTVSQILRDFGIANYLIQEKELTKERTRTAMGIGLILGTIVALSIVALAEPMAVFYANAGVAHVLYILSLTFVLNAPNSIGLALLRRNFEFGRAFWLETTSNLAWAIIAVGLAYAGESYRSLAWASLGSNVILLSLFVTIHPDLVLILPSLRQWRWVARYGSFDTAANLVSQIGVYSPAIVMGRILGFSAVAYYNRGNSLTKMFRDTIESATRIVALPVFAAQLRRGEFDKAGYLHATTLITGISWPFFSFLTVMAYPVTRILFGHQWDAAVPAVQYLAVSNIVNGLSILAPFVMIAVGYVHLTFYKELAIQGVRLVLVVAFSFYSFEAVAASQIAVYVVAVAVNHFLLTRLTDLTWGDLVRASRSSALVTGASVIGPIMVALFYPPGPEFLWPPLLLAAVMAAGGWLAAVFWTEHPAREEVAIILKNARPAFTFLFRKMKSAVV